MAKRTVEEGFYGSAGMGDPMGSFTERTLRVAWDFGKKPVTQGAKTGGAVKAIPLLALPKGFCIDRVSVVQTKPMSAALSVTFGLASDDSKTVGGTVALGASASALARSSAQAGSSGAGVFADAEDMLCMLVPVATGDTPATFGEGAFDLCVHGFEAFAEGVGANPLGASAYRQTLQTQDNVSGGMMPLD